MTRPALLSLFLLLFSSTLTANSVFFVSPKGDDAWSGLQAKPGLARKDGPFRTIERCQRAIRDLKRRNYLANSVSVVLREGTYELEQPLLFTPEDTGGKSAPVTYRAYPGERVVIRGGRKLDGWTSQGDNQFSCPLQEQLAIPGRILVTNGEQHLPLARFPNIAPAHPISGGFLYVKQTKMVENSTYVRLLENRLSETIGNGGQQSIVAQIWTGHGKTRLALPVLQVSSDGRNLTLPKAPGIVPGSRLFLNHAEAFLDAPGEWWIDREKGELRTVIDHDRKKPQNIRLATIPNLIQITGTADNPVTHLHFERIEFTEACEALISAEAAAFCSFTACRFTLSGAEGIRLKNSSFNRIEGCDFAETGTAAVQILSTPTRKGEKYALVSDGNQLLNNWITRSGRSDYAEGAIIAGAKDGNYSKTIVRQNLIHDVPASGIILRGSQIRCELNRLHHLNQEFSGGAAIYLPAAGETEKEASIRDNVIWDTGGYACVGERNYVFPHGSSGIFVNGGKAAKIFGNVIARAPRSGIRLAGEDHLVENNIITHSGVAQVELGNTKDTRLLRNIFRFDCRNSYWLFGTNWPKRLKQSDWNLIDCRDDAPRISGILSTKMGAGSDDPWDTWQRLGYDIATTFADPLFLAPELEDYTIREDSLALKIGFIPINYQRLGAVSSKNRFSWPIDDDPWREKHLLVPLGRASLPEKTP